VIADPRIRPYRHDDRADVFEVCVRTGTGDPAVLPDVYAAPYLSFDPSLAFVVDTGERVAGYILATADTREFVRRYRSEWLPPFVERHGVERHGVERHGAEPSQVEPDGVLAAGLRPERMLVPGVDEYPAHLHIDLLPEIQRQGLGRMLVDTLTDALRARGVRGLHLVADPENTAAIAFYERLGFVALPAPPQTGALMGMTL
jgi:ribosomal protein S18 acetylase RimI-like enzyme